MVSNVYNQVKFQVAGMILQVLFLKISSTLWMALWTANWRVKILRYTYLLLTNNTKFINDSTSFVSPGGQRPGLTIDFMILLLIFVENCLWYDAIHDFSVWLRTGFNPPDVNLFQSLFEITLPTFIYGLTDRQNEL